MLSTIRGGMNSIVVLFLMGLLIASFAIFGIGDIFTSRGLIVAQVEDAEIDATSYLREFQNRVTSLRGQFGGNFTTQQAIAFGLHDVVLGELVIRAMIDENVRGLGLRGADATVLEVIQDTQAFQTPGGGFSAFVYRSALARAGYTPNQFENLVRMDISRAQLLDSLSAARIAPDVMVEAIYAYREEQRKATILTIPASAISGLDVPSDEALLSSYQDNSGLYMAPEYRDLSFMLLSPANFAAELTISDDQLREEYDARIDLYEIPERRELEVVIIPAEDAARTFYARVQAGEDYASLAEEITGFTLEDISLGALSRRDVNEDYSEIASEAVFALEAGAITEPVQTIFVWHVFRVVSIIQRTLRSFDEVREELRQLVAEDQGIGALFDVAAQIDDEIAGGGDMENISRATGLTILRYERLARSGLNSEGQLPEGIEDLLPYVAAAFTLFPEDELELFEMDNGGYYLVQVNGIIAPVVKPYEDVADQVRQRWFDLEQNRLAGERANDALARVRRGEATNGLALEYGGDIIETDYLRRSLGGRNIGVAPNVASLIFSTPAGETDMERASTGDGYVIIRVDEVIKGNPLENPGRLRSLRSGIRDELEQDILAQYQAALQAITDIYINQDLLDSMFTEDGLQLPVSIPRLN